MANGPRIGGVEEWHGDMKDTDGLDSVADDEPVLDKETRPRRSRPACPRLEPPSKWPESQTQSRSHVYPY
jgi:hypothetical protein